MNRYAMLAQAHWRQHSPARFAALPNRETFFSELGVLVESQVLSLSRILAGATSPSESFLARTARLAGARRQAEEIVMHQLVWVSDPSVSLTDAREEWDETTASDDFLIRWADRMQDSPDLMPSTTELEQMADDWAVPTEFLHGLVTAESPVSYFRAHRALLSEAATLRFLRELH